MVTFTRGCIVRFSFEVVSIKEGENGIVKLAEFEVEFIMDCVGGTPLLEIGKVTTVVTVIVVVSSSTHTTKVSIS